jgi:hypothetical protein
MFPEVALSLIRNESTQKGREKPLATFNFTNENGIENLGRENSNGNVKNSETREFDRIHVDNGRNRFRKTKLHNDGFKT